MRITFCGTGAGSVTATRAGTCILLDDGMRGVLLDCGHGSLGSLIRSGFPPTKAPTLILSHLHVDHVHGFSEWLASLVRPGGVLPTVFGPSGSIEYIGLATRTTSLVVSLPGQSLGTPLEVPVLEVADGDEVQREEVQFRSIVVPHAPEVVALAHRVEFGGTKVVYSGDTQAVPELMVPLAEGADILVHEAYSESGLDDWTQGATPARRAFVVAAFSSNHTRVDVAARIAAEAGLKRLVLTHLNPGEKPERLKAEAAAHFRGEIVVAEDGLALTI